MTVARFDRDAGVGLGIWAAGRNTTGTRSIPMADDTPTDPATLVSTGEALRAARATGAGCASADAVIVREAAATIAAMAAPLTSARSRSMDRTSA